MKGLQSWIELDSNALLNLLLLWDKGVSSHGQVKNGDKA